MHCQIHGASTASCRCHKCQSLLCIACWSDHCLDVHGNYPAELDIPHGQEDQSRMRTTGSSNLRTSVSASWQADRKGGPSERQSQQPRSSSPSPKATELTSEKPSIPSSSTSNHCQPRHLPASSSHPHLRVTRTWTTATLVESNKVEPPVLPGTAPPVERALRAIWIPSWLDT